MKTDLFTAIVTAIIGVFVAFFVTNALMGPVGSVTIKVVEDEVNANLSEPDPEVFNYQALNPTVEVYVGECDEYDEFGECVEAEAKAATNEATQGSE